MYHPVVYFVCTYVTNNLGDIALDYQCFDFIHKTIPNAKIIPIQYPQIYLNTKQFFSMIKPKDIIIYRPGGNMGNEYFAEEYARQLIIKNCPSNKIILMPQTVYFTDKLDHTRQDIKWFAEKFNFNEILNKCNYSREDFIKEFKNVYSNRKNLYIFAREKTSYQYLKELLPSNNIYLCPDLIFGLKNNNIIEERKNILLMLRSDRESSLSIQAKNEICGILSKFGKVTESDMIIDKNIGFELAPYYIKEKTNELYKAKVVVTDRLHGLIFSVITGTPCLFFSNYNHKLTSMRYWIKKYKYIIPCKNAKEIETSLQKIDYSKKYRFNYKHFRLKFAKLKATIRNAYWLNRLT